MNKTLRRLMTLVIAFACVVIAGVAVTAPAKALANDAWKDAARKLTFNREDFDYTDDATKDKPEALYYKIKVPAQLEITLTTKIAGNYATKNSGVDRVKVIIRNSKGEVIRSSKELVYDEANNVTVDTFTQVLKKGTYYIEIKEVVTSKGDKVTILPEAKVSTYPKTVTATQNGGKVTLKWSKVKTASGYSIHRATSKKGEFVRVKSIGGANSTSYTTKKLMSGRTYYFKVVAYLNTDNKTFTSDFSKVIAVKIQ